VRRLTAPSGLDAGISRGRPAIGSDIFVAERMTRPLGALAPVAATSIPRRSRRIQYWMVNGMVREADRGRVRPELQYDFTYLPDRPIGWERNKTMGHAHSRPAADRLGYAEVCEILEGTVGFMIQDLHTGPRATYAALVVGRPGERIVLPPLLQHASIHLGGDVAVFSDVICREAKGVYDPLRVAHGMAWFIDVDGEARANPAYASVPTLQHFTADEWSGPAGGPLYEQYATNPGSLQWIHDSDRFPEAFPSLWSRVEPTIAALERGSVRGQS
jgi:oxalate decarboxylase/phosphoglucose isomerase-like protein (cupin superfamily)